MYVMLLNNLIHATDYRGLAEVSVNSDPELPDPANLVPQEISGKGSQSGTKYSTKIFECDCICNGPKDYTIKCNITFSAEITIDINQAGDPKPTLAGIYGHEQRHVAHRLGLVNALIGIVKSQDGGAFKSNNSCTNSKKEWEVTLYNDFKRIFPAKDDVSDDAHDPRKGDDDDPRPGNGEEFEPFPGKGLTLKIRFLK